MGTRSYADVPPTAGTIALNAYIFGYGGHSLVTPHATLKQLWWTDERIERKVTRSFVVSKLRGEEREFLDKPLAFGEGLTDDTYMEWIMERAKRLFLILTMIGLPDQIFGCIDDSWDDDDLPISFENVQNLELSYEEDQVLNKKFYDMQFKYLLRELRPGAHIDYGPNEHIPMEYVNTLPPAVSLQQFDRVHFPGRPDEVFMRRKFSLTDADTGASHRESFMRDVRRAQTLRHEHVANVWASYISEDAGYILSDFVGQHTLGTFIDHRTPTQFMRVPPSERPAMLCEWMHCLTDALASLHHRGVAHAAIRPSNILIDHDNHIAFADVGTVRTFQRGKKPQKSETYDYAAPESQICRQPFVLAPSSPPLSSIGAFSKLRKLSTGTHSSSSGSSSTGSSTRSNSICASANTSPPTPMSAERSNSLMTLKSALSPFIPPRPSSSSFRNFSRHLQHEPCPSPSVPTSPRTMTPVTILPLSPRSTTFTDTEPSLRDLPEPVPEQGDIFSLGCIFLDIITFMIKGRTTDFVRFRSNRIALGPERARKFRTDHSFHCGPDKIDAWICILREDGEKLACQNQVFRGVDALLKLVKKMMAQNAALRPSALEVRDQLQDILVGHCSIEHLCCAGRTWDIAAPPEAIGAGPVRDSFQITTGIFGSAPRKGTEAQRHGSTSGDHMSILSRIPSRAIEAEEGAEAPIVANTSRRRSSASTATAKLTSWRRAWSRTA